MRAVSISSIFIFIFTAASTVSAAPGQKEPNWVCKEPGPLGHGQVWHLELAHDFRAKAGVAKGSIGQGDCTFSQFWNAWNGPRTVDRKTKIPQDGQLHMTGKKEPGVLYICDHVVELNMIKRIMELPGGVCDVAQAAWLRGGADRAAALASIKEIRTVLNDRTNLYLLEKSVEKRKGDVVHDTGPFATWNYFDISEVHDYLNVHGPGTRALARARALDQKVVQLFPAAENGQTVSGIWITYTRQVKAYYLIIKRQAEQKKKTDQCNNGTPTTGSPTVKRSTPRLSRTHLFNMMFSGGIDSSLTRRGPRTGASRAGPNAPPCQSCKKPAQPKKVVNKDAAKTKPPPATKPRRPKTTPAPRPRNPSKQVARRPASRARREVGKQQPVRRVKPRKQPRVVPKPTRRPKGKPRRRRR